MGRRCFVEGKLDRAVIVTLGIADEESVKTSEKGREAAIELAATTNKTMGSPDTGVLVLDRNGSSKNQLTDEVKKKLKKVWQTEPVVRKEGWFFGGRRPLHLVTAGLPGEHQLIELGVERFMMDDYLLKLCLNDKSLRAFCEGEKHLKFKPENSAELKEILLEMTESLRKRSIAVDSSKRYIDLIRAVTGFQASRAVFAEKIVERCPSDLREEVFTVLCEAIRADPPQ